MIELDPKPSKKNILEPVFSPIRNDLSSYDYFNRLKNWRMNKRHFNMRNHWVVWIEYLELWVIIPKGFVFDGASVPKALHSFINSIDALFYGSIIHDFIYRTNQLIVCEDESFGDWYILEDIGKTKADKIMFYFSKQMEGIILPNAVALVILTGLGWFAWWKLRRKGLHLLTAFPSETNSVLTYYN